MLALQQCTQKTAKNLWLCTLELEGQYRKKVPSFSEIIQALEFGLLHWLEVTALL
jgi:hypothetical protein